MLAMRCLGLILVLRVDVSVMFLVLRPSVLLTSLAIGRSSFLLLQVFFTARQHRVSSVNLQFSSSILISVLTLPQLSYTLLQNT